jgi:hypothetical protein
MPDSKIGGSSDFVPRIIEASAGAEIRDTQCRILLWMMFKTKMGEVYYL